ncbi:MAG: HDOD domain-containing protein [Sulfurospirillaceae bacterium]|nr:HDOD domain-containing protein [Sulfurospirillaceae bacterium]MDD3463243.1 HDOD domain-containing protein [Sulfurospirillaceae bacterium]
MLTCEQIESYVASIPSLSKNVRECLKYLDDGNLGLCADTASHDKALMFYLASIVNKPIFGFRNDISNPRQIFSILGVVRAKQILYSYYISLITPKKWEVFDFSTQKFQDFQARLIFKWEKILKSLNIENEELSMAVTIIPASLAFCDMLFRDMLDIVLPLREVKQISYEEILYKTSQKTFFDICALVAKKWDFSTDIVDFIVDVGNKEVKSDEKHLAVAYLRMLLLQEMSTPTMMQGGFNDFFEFELDFSEEMLGNFFKLIEKNLA